MDIFAPLRAIWRWLAGAGAIALTAWLYWRKSQEVAAAHRAADAAIERAEAEARDKRAISDWATLTDAERKARESRWARRG